MEPSIDGLIARLPRLTLVVGKGGVGKTTCAGALALRCAARHPTLVLSTDPAGTLGDVLGMDALPTEPTPVPNAGDTVHLDALQLDAAAHRTRFLARWRD